MGWNIPQEKTVEVRKDYPKASDWNNVAHIYCSKNRKSFNRIPKWYQPFMEKLLGKVVGEFVCDRIEQNVPDYNPVLQKFFYGYVIDLTPTCLSEENLHKYAGIEPLYFWHISNLEIYDKPKELGEFKREGFMTEEQWLYALYPNTHCHYEAWAKRFELTRPPQSWCYCEVSE